ncbi:MAG: hypothetical protein NT031_16135 [Planctomycetota bacterium]|nr:hypothetical protein [Planctomycetota bacterium]
MFSTMNTDLGTALTLPETSFWQAFGPVVATNLTATGLAPCELAQLVMLPDTS